MLVFLVPVILACATVTADPSKAPCRKCRAGWLTGPGGVRRRCNLCNPQQ
ncbi:hypothetical protein [Streptomyces sp. SID3343]|nr:hypothetical protein [Streptomyces sp. SID3343]MYW00233.1 hypothetical protein [Streptomyces sp. SID3343]